MIKPGEIQKIAGRFGIRDTQIEKRLCNRMGVKRNIQ